MKKYAAKGMRLATGVLLAVLAMAYTTDVSAADETVVTKTGLSFVDKQGEQTVQQKDEIKVAVEDKEKISVTGIQAQNVEKLNINADVEDSGLFIGSQAQAFKNGDSVALHFEDAKVNFAVDGNLNIAGNSSAKDAPSGSGDVSLRAVGMYGKNGSSEIQADKFMCYTSVNDYRNAASTEGKFDAVALGMVYSNYNIGINSAEGISVLSWINNKKSSQGKMTAQGLMLANGSKAKLQAEESIIIATLAQNYAANQNDTKKFTHGPLTGIYSAGSELDMQAGGQITLGVLVDGLEGNNDIAVLKANNSAINIKGAKEISLQAVNYNGGEVYSILADNNSTLNLESDAGILLKGNVKLDNSLLSLKTNKTSIGNNQINGNIAVGSHSTLKLGGTYFIGEDNIVRSAVAAATTTKGNLTVDNSTLIIDGFTLVDNITKMNNAKLYFYDAQTQDDVFHALSTKELQLEGTNELYLRADSSKDSDVNRLALNSDVVGFESIAGNGRFDVHVLDEGMKTGYGMSADGEKALANKITVFYNSNGNVDLSQLVNSVQNTTYDNGIWEYAYSMDAEQDGESLVIKKVNVNTQASASQLQATVQDANKAAAAMAVTVLGEDEALRTHLRDVREHKDNENVWASYRGGKLKADGAVSDVQVKYNGVEVGYDAYVGDNWSFGVSGQQVRGNTQLASGSGKVKTNVGSIYGTWQGDGGAYVNLEARAGRISSESKNFVLADDKHDFSAPAYGLSAEYGVTRELAHDWFVEQALRLSYVHMGAADYSVRTQDTTARVANDSFNSLALRGGAKLGKRLGESGYFYVQAAGVYDFDGDVTTTVSADGRSARYERELGGWGVEYGAGVDYRLSKAACFNLDVERRSGGELLRDWGVNVGFNYSF